MARTIASPRPEPGARRRPRRARSDRRPPPRCPAGSPAPASVTATSATPSRGARTTSTLAAVRPVEGGVLEQVLERARAARRVRRRPSPAPRSRRLALGRRPPPPTRSSSATCRSGAARALALERQQVVDQPPQPLGVGFEVGDHLRVGRRGGRGTRRCRAGRSAASAARGWRRRGSGARARARPRARASIAFSVRRQARRSPPGRAGAASRRVGILGALDRGRRGRELSQRPGACAGSAAPRRAPPSEDRPGAAPGAAAGSSSWTVSSMSAVLAATITTPPAAGPPASAIGAAKTRIGSSSSSASAKPAAPAERRGHLRPARQQLRPERQRAGDDRAAAVEHLDAQLATRDRRFERTRRSRGPPAPRRSAARLRSARVRRLASSDEWRRLLTTIRAPTPRIATASRTAAIAARVRRALMRGAEPHASSMKPTPHTVRISSGSSSFRRSRAT